MPGTWLDSRNVVRTKTDCSCNGLEPAGGRGRGSQGGTLYMERNVHIKIGHYRALQKSGTKACVWGGRVGWGMGRKGQ